MNDNLIHVSTVDRKLVVIGHGHVGGPLAMRAVDVSLDVVGYDLDKRKISGLVAGASHIDDVTDDDIIAALATGRYLPSEVERDLEGFEVVAITVPTPLTDGAPDFSFIEWAIETLARYLTEGALVVLESTTYPGTTREVVLPMLESGFRIGDGEGLPPRLVAGADRPRQPHVGFSDGRRRWCRASTMARWRPFGPSMTCRWTKNGAGERHG